MNQQDKQQILAALRFGLMHSIFREKDAVIEAIAKLKAMPVQEVSDEPNQTEDMK